jgi:pimeloyl-ACP methyl ester carboxylesterase
VEPARREGYREIWLVGVSLGGMGALAHARDYPEATTGLILLAPFLGTRGTVAEVGRAGGLGAWEPDAATREHPDGALLFWLKTSGRAPIVAPEVHLGYGRDDRFGAASRLLESRLPASRVVSVEGGHDWPTWRRLWPMLIAASGLPRAGATA